MSVQLTDFERVEKVKNFLNIGSWRQFASIIGAKNGQIFSNLKTKKNKMSANLAARICAIDPLINYEWLLTGEGEMLRPSAGPVVANNSDNTAAHINVATAGASINETERWLALYEAQQREREKLHAEREKLTDTLVEVMKKLAAGLPAIIIIAAALSLSACNKDSGCHWHVVSHQWSEDNPVGMGYIDSTLYCEGAPVVSRHHGW